MMPSGIEYLFFFPAVLLVHWLVPRRAGAQNAVLLVASYLFFASWQLSLLPVIVAATLIDYALARFMDARRAHAPALRAALAIGVLHNVALLAWFKYAGFFVHGVVLPLGISFWTMTKLGYLIDVYHGRVEACRSLPRFATFVAFFPQLIAGPIVRADEMLPQYGEPRRLDPDRLRAGAGAFLLGYVMKAMVADWLSVAILDPGWPQAASYSTAGHWLLLVLYAVQIFCDFAGYSLLAIGTGRLLGLELPMNFNYPFLSRSLIELWRRWHMSLNRWLFDYLFGPLTTGESWFRGRIRASFLVVFALSGIWHGARATYLVWGVVHGIGLAVWQTWDDHYRSLCRRDRVWVARRKHPAYLAAAWAATQLFFLLTLVLFRAGTLAEAGRFLAALFVPRGGALLPDYHVVTLRVVTLASVLGFVLVYHLLELERGKPVRARLLAAPAVVRGVAYGLVIVYLLLLMPISASAFVYGAF